MSAGLAKPGSTGSALSAGLALACSVCSLPVRVGAPFRARTRSQRSSTYSGPLAAPVASATIGCPFAGVAPPVPLAGGYASVWRRCGHRRARRVARRVRAWSRVPALAGCAARDSLADRSSIVRCARPHIAHGSTRSGGCFYVVAPPRLAGDLAARDSVRRLEAMRKLKSTRAERLDIRLVGGRSLRRPRTP